MLPLLRCVARAWTLASPLALALACASGQEVQSTEQPSLADASVEAGPAASGGVGAMVGTGGAPAIGAGGVEGAGGASDAGGAAGAPSDCADQGQKRCGGLCLAPSPAIGCGMTGCNECPNVTNGFAECAGDDCSFDCNPGFSRSGSECQPVAVDGGVPGCTNGMRDGAETDVDCGGADCPGCGDGDACEDGGDCASGSCDGPAGAGTCQSATCNDGVRNGSETDMDCGGNCGATCQAGDMCSTDGDCADGPCSAGVCDCSPASCGELAGQCGSIDDGCGGTVRCNCATGETCVQGTCRQDSVGGFGYSPSNFDPAGLAPPSSDTVLDCGESTFDSTTLAFGNWCGQEPPTPVTRSQSGGPEVVILPLGNLSIPGGATLRITGTRPVILAVFGNATIGGTLDASANGTTPGPGGNLSCGASQGQNGTGSPGRWPGDSNAGASGGGGGGFGSPGGRGGASDTDNNGCGNCAGGAGGSTRGMANLVPLVGGCGGGRAGGCDTDGGAGGGAVQVSASGMLSVTGAVRANGGAGATPCGAQDEGGGTGGGSGGGILLEGDTLNTSGATLQANGGRGGRNGSSCGVLGCGNTDGGAGSTNSSDPGGNGRDRQAGGPGGGGGYGRVELAER